MTQLFYDSGKLRIRVCCGMNCSASDGGRPLEEAFEAALKEDGVLDQVELLRAHCLGECPDGPCVRIDGERFYHVHAADVPQLVRGGSPAEAVTIWADGIRRLPFSIPPKPDGANP